MDDIANKDPEVTGVEHGFIGKPVSNYTIVFDNEDELKRFHTYIRLLKKKYPEVRTIGQRIDRHLQDTILNEPKQD